MRADTVANTSGKSKISPARAAAFHILLELSRSASAHSDDLLHSDKVDALSPQDRNLCTALTLGVLRWQIFLDAAIAPLLTHKARLDDPVRIALRMAAFQLLFYDRIPAHAAISDSVELTKRSGHRFASGLVNAVLRKLAVHAQSTKQRIDPARAHPEWLLQRWAASMGEANVSAVCAYNQQQPPTHIRLVSEEAEAALLQEGIVLAASTFLRDCRRVLSGDAAASATVRSGCARIQDEGSQLIAELLNHAGPDPHTILDCCAAPGGKTAIIAARHPHCRIVACDISAARVASMKQFFDKQPAPARIECRISDATQPSPLEKFDRILCDVPCTGTGTLSRNPEIKLRLVLEDIMRQQSRQIEILRASLHALAPGGELVYSTCSLESEEDEDVVEAVLASDPSVRIIPIQKRVDTLATSGILHAAGHAMLTENCIRGNYLRTTPGFVPMDGFFAAIFKRA